MGKGMLFLFAVSLLAATAGRINAADLNAGPDSLRSAADMCFARHEYKNAATIYDRLFKADSTDSILAALLASCHMRDGEYGKAAGLFIKALKLNPELRLCQLGLVECCYQQGQIKEASQWAEKVRSAVKGAQLADWDRLVEQKYPLIIKPEKK